MYTTEQLVKGANTTNPTLKWKKTPLDCPTSRKYPIVNDLELYSNIYIEVCIVDNLFITPTRELGVKKTSVKQKQELRSEIESDKGC